jgi:hypothetical protein
VTMARLGSSVVPGRYSSLFDVLYMIRIRND